MHTKNILITGATSGIGAQTALALAKPDCNLYLLVRDVPKGESLKQNIIAQTQNNQIYIIQCDLADMQSVRQATIALKKQINYIDVLINNAGGIFPERRVITAGFENTFAVNHLGHFLLTMLLMPLLQKGKARIINVSSEAHRAAKVNFRDLQAEHNYSSMTAYGNAKLFNILFTKSLAERYAVDGITAYSLHPGIVNTQFGSQSTGFIKFLLQLARPFMISPEKGAQTSIFLATSPHLEPLSGKYFKNKAEARSSAPSYDNKARQKLWLKSEALVVDYLL